MNRHLSHGQCSSSSGYSAIHGPFPLDIHVGQSIDQAEAREEQYLTVYRRKYGVSTGIDGIKQLGDGVVTA